VYGHDNFPDGPLLYEGRSNLDTLNLDTLAWRIGRLVIGIFDDAKAGGEGGWAGGSYRDQGIAGWFLKQTETANI
jgi:hypothetical protein